TLLGGAAAAPCAARAQGERMKLIGYVVGSSDDAEGWARFTAFREGLAARGWIERRNIEIVARFGAADPVRMQRHVAELVGLAPQVIVSGDPPTVAAIKKEAPAIPIVMPSTTDLIAAGLAESLARPGGNVTG